MAKNTRERLDPETRKEAILAAAVRRAQVVGLAGLRRDDVAAEAKVSQGLVTLYFNTMTQLKRAVIRYAVHAELLPLIAQALAANEPEAKKAPADLRKRALATLQ